MNLEVLIRFGLHKNDVKIYQSLLSMGRSKTGPIIKATNIRSSAVYDSLRNLIDKGIVSYQIKNNIKYYQAESPKELIREAEKNKEELEKLSDEVDNFPIPHLSRNEVNVYEGEHGFKLAFRTHIENLRPHEAISIMAFGAREGNSKRLRKFLNSIMGELSKKKCKTRILRDIKQKEMVPKYTSNKRLEETRFLPSHQFSPTAMNISETEVLLSVWGTKPVVFSMRNKEMVASFRKNFEFLWEKAKKK